MPQPFNIVGRLAPSPTGLLHIGNARSLLLAWLSARRSDGRICLRIEDLLPDGHLHLAALLRDLDWLGLDWDAPIRDEDWQPAALQPDEARTDFTMQSRRFPLYERTLRALVDLKLAYPCVCTRKDIDLAANAPHLEDEGVPYPGTCRERFHNAQAALQFDRDRATALGRPPLGIAWRLRTPATSIAFFDQLRGSQSVDLSKHCGDIVLQRKDAGFAYMFAVVIDDLAMGVNQIVRGDDLLEVTAQQIAVYQALAQLPVQNWLAIRARELPLPDYFHVPLVLDDDGRRLAKRNKSLHLQQLRLAGVRRERVILWLGQSVGVANCTDLPEMAKRFDWSKVPKTPVCFGRDELATLLVPSAKNEET